MGTAFRCTLQWAAVANTVQRAAMNPALQAAEVMGAAVCATAFSACCPAGIGWEVDGVAAQVPSLNRWLPPRCDARMICAQRAGRSGALAKHPTEEAP